MNLSHYEPVPFTRDYYKELTPQETADILDMNRQIKQASKDYTVEMGVKSFFYCVISIAVLTFLINGFDLQNALQLDYSLWFICRVVLSIISYGIVIFFWIREFIFALKDCKNSEDFFIAKGIVLQVKVENVNTDIKYNKDGTIVSESAYHFNGQKIIMDMAISDKEMLSDMDISMWQSKMDKITPGTVIVCLYYPKEKMYFYKFYT